MVEADAKKNEIIVKMKEETERKESEGKELKEKMMNFLQSKVQADQLYQKSEEVNIAFFNTIKNAFMQKLSEFLKRPIESVHDLNEEASPEKSNCSEIY